MCAVILGQLGMHFLYRERSRIFIKNYTLKLKLLFYFAWKTNTEGEDFVNILITIHFLSFQFDGENMYMGMNDNNPEFLSANQVKLTLFCIYIAVYETVLIVCMYNAL